MMLWPNGSMTEPEISSAFGWRESPIEGASTFHRGTDFTDFDTVCAIADGDVVQVGWVSGWLGGGIQVWMQHDGAYSRSLHLTSVLVRVGDRVSAGTPLGVMGSTGTATGKHLHLEVGLGEWSKNNAGQIDPVPFIHGGLANLATAASAPLIVRKDEDMIFMRRQANNAAYAVDPGRFIKHIPDAHEEFLATYITDGEAKFNGLNDTDTSTLLWTLGFPELEGDIKKLPLNGAYYWSPRAA